MKTTLARFLKDESGSTAVEYGLTIPGLRVFADLWDVERFFDCGCAGHRAARLRVMNREQRAQARVVCACDTGH